MMFQSEEGHSILSPDWPVSYYEADVTCLPASFGSVVFNLDQHIFELQATLLKPAHVDPKFLFDLGTIWIVHIGIICIGRDRDLPICPVLTKIRITHVCIKQTREYNILQSTIVQLGRSTKNIITTTTRQKNNLFRDH